MESIHSGDIGTAEAKGLNMPQVQCPVYHHFGPGIYIRELWIPKGTLIIGHHHRESHLNMMLRGKLRLFGDGGHVHIVEAPFRLVAGPGRKAAYALEDTIWQNIYATEETDVNRLEEILFEKSDQWQEAEIVRTASTVLLPSSYDRMLADINMTAEQVWELSNRSNDMVPFRSSTRRVKVGNSPIHGYGLFATTPFGAGDFIEYSRYGDKRTPAGRFTNHSDAPNAEMICAGEGSLYLQALRPINGCLGGFDGEEITVDYRQALAANKRSQES
jgi:hypothetical protein